MNQSIKIMLIIINWKTRSVRYAQGSAQVRVQGAAQGAQGLAQGPEQAPAHILHKDLAHLRSLSITLRTPCATKLMLTQTKMKLTMNNVKYGGLK